MKTYNSPMLQVVSIKKNNIITTSTVTIYDTEYNKNNGSILGADRFRDDWDAGY